MLPIAIPGCLVMLAVIICIRAGFRTIDGSVRAKSEGRCASAGRRGHRIPRRFTDDGCAQPSAQDQSGHGRVDSGFVCNRFAGLVFHCARSGNTGRKSYISWCTISKFIVKSVMSADHAEG